MHHASASVTSFSYHALFLPSFAFAKPPSMASSGSITIDDSSEVIQYMPEVHLQLLALVTTDRASRHRLVAGKWYKDLETRGIAALCRATALNLPSTHRTMLPTGNSPYVSRSFLHSRVSLTLVLVSMVGKRHGSFNISIDGLVPVMITPDIEHIPGSSQAYTVRLSH